MDINTVPNFLTHEASKYIMELANPTNEMIQQAQKLYLASGGRLPSLPLPEPLKPSRQLEAFKQEFADGINDFLERLKDGEASQAFACGSSWDKLQGEADKAWAAYNNHKARKRTWRRPFEAVDNAAEKVMTSSCIEFLLELVPNGDYSSLLSGGLTLAYNTALRKEKYREDILELFDSLSHRAEQTKANIQLYSRDPQLHAKSEELYMAVLDCVRHSTAWLDKSSAFESFKAFFQQSKYGKKWEDAKANLDKKVQEFDETVNMCLRRQVQDIHKNVEWMKAPLVAIYSLLAGFTKDFPSILAAQLQQAQQMQPPTVMYMTNLMYSQQTTTFQEAMPPPMATITSWQLRQGLSVEYMHNNQSPIPGQQYPLDPISLALSDLNANITTAMHHIPPPLEREKMGFLTLSPQFISWLRGTDSTFLVLHESSTGINPTSGSLSTLSHLCGLISQTLRSTPTPGMWIIPFFCGLHTSASATLQGGLGIMRAVTLQLLSTIPDATFPLPASVSDPPSLTQQLLSGSLDATCLVFSLILSQIPAGMIFILIDGAHWNGTQARSEDMRAVVRFLYKLVEQLRQARRGLVLKVLVTNPGGRQRGEWDIASPGDRDGEGVNLDLYMERQVVAGGFQGVVERVVQGHGG